MDEKILLKPIKRSSASLAQELQDCLILLRRSNLSDTARKHLCTRVEQIQNELDIKNGRERKNETDSDAQRSDNDMGRTVGCRPERHSGWLGRLFKRRNVR